MLKGQIHSTLLPEHPIIGISNNEFKMAAVSVKRSIPLRYRELLKVVASQSK